MWAVWYNGETIDDIYDVVIGRPDHTYFNRRIVRMVRRGNPDVRLCEVHPDNRSTGWCVIVYHGQGALLGPGLVYGFATMRAAIEYAVQIRPDINPQAKRDR
jgi:hypothetical protein